MVPSWKLDPDLDSILGAMLNVTVKTYFGLENEQLGIEGRW